MASPPTTPRRSPLTRLPSSPLRPTSPTLPRPASGPPSTTSRRVSNTSTPATPSPGGAPKTKARDLLRKHYGLGVGPPTPSQGRLAADPMDLDSTGFDAKAYYEQLITTSSLPTLLRRENDLLTEIRELDSERQSLVYNHHHELIAASDTIAAMKARAEHLDADMDLLKAAFSEISRLSAAVAVETAWAEG
ncbi:hypothetical protein EIP86_002224 [Pleurotus ostreatoroseus]|nr:hypothetical protein EIP86_002224 [Pleurotus ostreatoroseus]